MRILSLDHLVLTVQSIEATCSFYAAVLGTKVITFGDSRKALVFGSQKINLHEQGKEFEPEERRTTDWSLVENRPSPLRTSSNAALMDLPGRANKLGWETNYWQDTLY